VTRVWRVLSGAEKGLSVTAISLMALLPCIAIGARLAGTAGISGSVVFVQQLTLCVAFLGAALAASGDHLLSMSANTFLSARWVGPARVFACGLATAIAAGLCWASWQFVVFERAGGKELALGIKTWVPAAVMPFGLLLVAVRAIRGAGPGWRQRTVAALFLLAPVILHMAGKPEGNAVVAIGIALVLAGAVLGLPIFATLGGIAMLLLWGIGQPVSDVPGNTYSLMVSEVLPSLPLYTLAGYILVEGGASERLLRVYNTFFGWLPGGLAISTAVGCAIFTWAGSGVTIVSMGGLLLPMLMKGRYSERFSIGLINASGSLGLLFPPSLPVILYAVYAKVDIKALFVGGFVPGLLMVAMVSAFGVQHGLRNAAPRAKFCFAEARRSLWEAKWELAVPVIVIVGLFGGFGATMVEAGAVTVVYSFIVEAFITRGFSPRRDFPRIALECVSVMGGVLMIIGVAKGLTYYLAIKDVPGMLATWVDVHIPGDYVALPWVGLHIPSKYVFLLLLNVVLLIKGSFMDVFSAIIVMVPLIVPVAAKFGIEPVQMGVIFLANLELGYLTPPIGMNLCLSAYRFKQPMTAVYRATLPFYLILLAGVLLITYVPDLTMLPVKWLGL
jgi:tripartite ATP-independent transporter DctM subunit